MALTADQARARLAGYREPEGNRRLAERAASVPAGAREAVRDVMDDDRVDLSEAGTVLDGLPDDARQRTFRALLPGLGELIGHTWSDLPGGPYAIDRSSTVFRSSKVPEHSAHTRGKWFRELLRTLRQFDKQGPDWLATWAGMLSGSGYEIGRLLGSAIDHGHTEVRETLLATARGEHEISGMGRHVLVALLSCSDPAAWESVEDLLVNAGRAEGLRESILDAADFAQPRAFRRILRLVLEHGLTRFAATASAVRLWLDEPFDVRDGSTVQNIIGELLELLESSDARRAALESTDPRRVYLGLWATACDDASVATEKARQLCGHSQPRHRIVATRLLARLRLPTAEAALADALADEDPRVVAAAVHTPLDAVVHLPLPASCRSEEIPDGLCALVHRLQKDTQVELGLWKPASVTLSPTAIADGLALRLDTSDPTKLSGIVARMSPDGRQHYVETLAADAGRHRAALFEHLTDRAESVRKVATRALSSGPAPTAEEVTWLESLLGRRGSGVRRAALTLLRHRPPAAVTDSANRLLAGTKAQAEAGRELAATTDEPETIPPEHVEHDWARERANRIREWIVAGELQRGELPGRYSGLVRKLHRVEGVATVTALLAALGSRPLRLTPFTSGEHRAESLCHLIQICHPASGESAEEFAAAVEHDQLAEGRLLDLAVYAPQWAPFVADFLPMDGLTEAVYWLHAHTQEDLASLDPGDRGSWMVELRERTPLEPAELADGAVDTEWLSRIRETLSDTDFDRVLSRAKHTSSGGGHKPAELFARTIRGEVSASELRSRISEKRHQDSVRALGLVPLPSEPDARKTEVSRRYELLRGWQSESKQFGRQRRASEDLAVRIALDNLARTAGYRDPQRLTWSMERESVGDLASGAVSASDGDVTVTLSIDETAAPVLTVRRGERALRSVPKASAENTSIAQLRQRTKTIRARVRRMRASLEEAAVHGERFSTAELDDLFDHPLLAPLLRNLVMINEEAGHGFPREGGVLVDPDGVERSCAGSASRIAHPVDLLESGRWPEWQRACFASRRTQPFKQVFRELYVPTEAERGGVRVCTRFAGRGVRPAQTVQLLGTRHWVTEAHDGAAMRTFHDERLSAHLTFDGSLIPDDTSTAGIEELYFTRVGDTRRLPLEDVPARLFSEVLRDVDLVVSVAHAGDAAPDASIPTVEARGRLVRETAGLLGLGNVELSGQHALITGTLGDYSVHLGSGTVHRRPGNAVCIVAVDPRHRAKLFVPFVEDDPRSAEVVSKVVLLARDHAITDPGILEQLRG